MVSHTRYGTCCIFHIDAGSALWTGYQFGTGDGGAGDMAYSGVALHVCNSHSRLDGLAYDHTAARFISSLFNSESALATQPTDQSDYRRSRSTRLLWYDNADREFLAQKAHD